MRNEDIPKKIGKYEILEEIGAGGFAKVYKAYDSVICREVAIKVIHSKLGVGTEGDRNYERFIKEAAIVATLKHNSIATIFEAGKTEEPESLPFIVMEYIHGRSLRKMIESGERFGLARTVNILTQICDALQVAHTNQKKIIHRDIKPDNILVDDSGKASLVDFGIARVEDSNLTQGNVALGTWAYMSPEQIEPDRFLKKNETVDARTDIYSLGIVLYEMVSGKKPFVSTPGAPPTKILYDIVHSPIPELEPKSDDLNIPGLKEIILKATKKNREERFSSCNEMAQALRSISRAYDQSDTANTTFIFDRSKTSSQTRSYTGSLEPGKALLKKYKKAAFVAGPVVLVIAGFLIWNQFLKEPAQYDQVISIAPFKVNTSKITNDEIEFMLDRSFTASQNLPVFLSKNGTAKDNNIERFDPLIQITGTINDTASATGFDIALSLQYKNQKKEKKFECMGQEDLLKNKINDIISYIQKETEPNVGPLSQNKKFYQITTSNWDAYKDYIDGQGAWEKLNTNKAASAFKSALFRDSNFGLANLKLAAVKLFDEDNLETKRQIDLARKNKDTLIDTDKSQLDALQARIDSNRNDERKIRKELAEKFSRKKEFQYDLAEAYFHSGDADNAIDQYQAAINLDKNYAVAYNHMALCYSWKGDHNKAIEKIKEYVSKSDKPEQKDPNAHDSFATIYMFQGEYRKAIDELDIANEADPEFDVYGNYATNFIFLGELAKAEDNIVLRQTKSSSDASEPDAKISQAYIETLRGNLKRAEKLLDSARNYYDQEGYKNNLDETPVLPFWLTGIIAYSNNDSAQLKAMINILELKKKNYKVDKIDYFPIYKFYIHLKALEAALLKDRQSTDRFIEEAREIKNRMGYWTSKFNVAYFFTEYAKIQYEVFQLKDKALALLGEVKEYNDSYAPAHILRAKILLSERKKAEAKQECDLADKLFKNADKDFAPLNELKKIEIEVSKL